MTITYNPNSMEKLRQGRTVGRKVETISDQLAVPQSFFIGRIMMVAEWGSKGHTCMLQ